MAAIATPSARNLCRSWTTDGRRRVWYDKRRPCVVRRTRRGTACAALGVRWLLHIDSDELWMPAEGDDVRGETSPRQPAFARLPPSPMIAGRCSNGGGDLAPVVVVLWWWWHSASTPSIVPVLLQLHSFVRKYLPAKHWHCLIMMPLGNGILKQCAKPDIRTTRGSSLILCVWLCMCMYIYIYIYIVEA